MRHRDKVLNAVLASVLLAQAQAWAQAISEDTAELQIKSCVVSSTRSPDKTYDCTTEAIKAAEACKQMEECEIPIGYNLTSGKDIDPGSGFLGKRVTIVYTCGGGPQQGGPYHQDDHASLVMDCSGMWW
jgi:hypothetical protein